MITSGYQLRRTTEPETEPVSLATAKNWLNLDEDITTDDALVTALIKAAREWVEKETTLVLVDSIWEMQLSDWGNRPGFWSDLTWGRMITIPVYPLIDVLDIQYLGNDGEYVRLDPAQYIVVKDEPPRIEMSQDPGVPWWPVVVPRPGAILVTFRAGFESAGSPQDATNVPESIKTAMQMMVAHWYEHREATSTDHRNTPSEIPLGARMLTDQYRRVM